MATLPQHLYNRCRELFAQCPQFRSDESLHHVFQGSEFEDYARFLNKAENPPSRVDMCIEALREKSNGQRPILALFAAKLAKEFPTGDDTGAALEELAQEILRTNSVEVSSPKSAIRINKHRAKGPLEGEEKEKNILLIEGRNQNRGSNKAAKEVISSFLEGAGLQAIEWQQIISRIQGNLSVESILNQAFDDMTQAVIVLFTIEDLVRPTHDVNTDATVPQFQPDPVTLFKAGIAFALAPTRTILVVLGSLRLFHFDLEQYVIRMTGDDEQRMVLISALKRAGCHPTKNDWMTKGNFANPLLSGKLL